MADEKKEGFDFGNFSIIVAVLFVVSTIAWIMLVNIFSKEKPNEITWVG